MDTGGAITLTAEVVVARTPAMEVIQLGVLVVMQEQPHTQQRQVPSYTIFYYRQQSTISSKPYKVKLRLQLPYHSQIYIIVAVVVAAQHLRALVVVAAVEQAR